MMSLLLFLSIALMSLAVGFARQEERLVTVPLQSSVRYKGQTYHPHSEGVEMPFSHARALGFSEGDFMGEKPEEEEDTSESESEGEPIPEDTPEYDELIKDERFATVEALLENQDELTDINGIAEKTAAKVVEHVKSNQEG